MIPFGTEHIIVAYIGVYPPPLMVNVRQGHNGSKNYLNSLPPPSLNIVALSFARGLGS